MAYRTCNCNELTLNDLDKQVMLAGWVDTIRDHGGVSFIDHGALCLETQFFPDSPNHPEFPFRFLKPGESFDSVTTYRFLTR